MPVINYIHSLPELVLELIFDNLKNESETLATCTRVSILWDRILWAKKPYFMFHLVLQLHFNVAPLVARHLTSRDMKHCRLVCHNWKDGVDGVNDQAPEWDSHIEQLKHVVPGDIPIPNKLTLPFSGRTGPRGIAYSVLEPTTRKGSNPFPSRTVYLLSPFSVFLRLWPSHDITDDSLFLRSPFHNSNFLDNVMDAYGAQIWHLVYIIEMNTYDGISVGEEFSTRFRGRLGFTVYHLVRLLEYVRNIRSLSLVIHYGRGCRNMFWKGGIPPVLSNLKSLTVRFPKCLPPITNFLFTSYSLQLESLECLDEDVMLLRRHQTPNDIPFAFPKLRNLKLRASRDVIPWLNLSLNSIYHQLKNLNLNLMAPHLEKMSLEVICLMECDFITLFNLTTRIRPFSHSLVQLYVNFVSLCDQEINQNYEDRQRSRMFDDAKFPSLEIFHIDTSHTSISPSSRAFLLFLEGMPSLRELRISRNEAEQVLSVYDTTLLWSTLPNLEKLYVGVDLQTRRSIQLRDSRIALEPLQLVRSTSQTLPRPREGQGRVRLTGDERQALCLQSLSQRLLSQDQASHRHHRLTRQPAPVERQVHRVQSLCQRWIRAVIVTFLIITFSLNLIKVLRLIGKFFQSRCQSSAAGSL